MTLICFVRLPSEEATEALKAALPTYFSVQLFDKGAVLFEATTASDRLFLIEHGTVSIIIPPESQKGISPLRSLSFQGEQWEMEKKLGSDTSVLTQLVGHFGVLFDI